MIHPSSSLVNYRNLTVPFQVLGLQPFRQNDRHFVGTPKHSGHQSSLLTPPCCKAQEPSQGPTSCFPDTTRWAPASPPVFSSCSHNFPQPTLLSGLTLRSPFSGFRSMAHPNAAGPKEPQPGIFFKAMNQLHRCQINTMISYIQSSSPAIRSKIWKSWLSLWSLVNQRDAQGQWLHNSQARLKVQ